MRLKKVTGERFRCGIVLHDGERIQQTARRLFATPVEMLWEGVKAVKPAGRFRRRGAWVPARSRVTGAPRRPAPAACRASARLQAPAPG